VFVSSSLPHLDGYVNRSRMFFTYAQLCQLANTQPIKYHLTHTPTIVPKTITSSVHITTDAATFDSLEFRLSAIVYHLPSCSFHHRLISAVLGSIPSIRSRSSTIARNKSRSRIICAASLSASLSSGIVVVVCCGVGQIVEVVVITNPSRFPRSPSVSTILLDPLS